MGAVMLHMSDLFGGIRGRFAGNHAVRRAGSTTGTPMMLFLTTSGTSRSPGPRWSKADAATAEATPTIPATVDVKQQLSRHLVGA
mmetsp:Transcript_144259/g.402054  ORF Transcript_144259/g.402054 Transcript_144259/m.402054 type:complete len:85 (+) Transcript_144259:1273-1527(+)